MSSLPRRLLLLILLLPACTIGFVDEEGGLTLLDDEDDVAAADDDDSGDDDDAGPDDDDVANDDDSGDDDDTAVDDDDTAVDDDDTVVADDDDTVVADDDDTAVDDDDTVVADDDDTVVADDDDTALPVCPEDAFEPNETELAASPITPGSYPALSACDGDLDWFSFEVGAGQSIDVDLFFSDAEGDIDVELYDPSGWLMLESTTNTDDESLSMAADVSGTWAVAAWLWGDAGSTPGNEYELDLTIGPCAPDHNEPNDSSLTATTLGLFYSDVGLTRCTGDVDWFEIYAYAGETLLVDLWFEHDATDLEVEIYDPAFLHYTGSYSGSDNELLAAPFLPFSGWWLVRVVAAANSDDAVPGTGYAIDVVVF